MKLSLVIIFHISQIISYLKKYITESNILVDSFNFLYIYYKPTCKYNHYVRHIVLIGRQYNFSILHMLMLFKYVFCLIL